MILSRLLILVIKDHERLLLRPRIHALKLVRAAVRPLNVELRFSNDLSLEPLVLLLEESVNA